MLSSVISVHNPKCNIRFTLSVPKLIFPAIHIRVFLGKLRTYLRNYFEKLKFTFLLWSSQKMTQKIKMSLSFKIFTWQITYYSYAMLCSHSNAITSKILFFPPKKLCSFDPCANVHPYHVDIMYITVGRIRGKTLFAKLTIMYYRISHTATVFMLST